MLALMDGTYGNGIADGVWGDGGSCRNTRVGGRRKFWVGGVGNGRTSRRVGLVGRAMVM